MWHERVPREEEGQGFIPVSLLTAVSTHEEHHFPVCYGGVGYIQVCEWLLVEPLACLFWSRVIPSAI